MEIKVILYSVLQVLQLKLSASPKSPRNSSSTSANSRAKEEEFEEDDDDNDIEDPETLNRTLTEIIDGKRSSTSLLALLNKEDTDSESIVSSSSSENSSSINKGRLIRTPSLSSKTNGSDISSIPEVTCDLENAGETLENSAIGQFREVDLSSETGYELNSANIDKNDTRCENQSADGNSETKHDAVTLNQSAGNCHMKGIENQLHYEISEKVNGEVPTDVQSVTGSKEVQFSLESNVHPSNHILRKPEQNRNDRFKTVQNITTTNQT